MLYGKTKNLIDCVCYLLARSANTCEVDGVIYQDGEQFKPDCRRLCSCQDGVYGCSTLCPQEERAPSRNHCKHPILIDITGKCCREWTCQVIHDPGTLAEEGLEETTVGKSCHYSSHIPGPVAIIINP